MDKIEGQVRVYSSWITTAAAGERRGNIEASVIEAKEAMMGNHVSSNDCNVSRRSFVQQEKNARIVCRAFFSCCTKDLLETLQSLLET